MVIQLGRDGLLDVEASRARVGEVGEFEEGRRWDSRELHVAWDVANGNDMQKLSWLKEVLKEKHADDAAVFLASYESEFVIGTFRDRQGLK